MEFIKKNRDTGYEMKEYGRDTAEKGHDTKAFKMDSKRRAEAARRQREFRKRKKSGVLRFARIESDISTIKFSGSCLNYF